MKSVYNMNKRGVFGLTSVQQFFAIVLGVTLLAFVIIVIMGVLQTSSLIPDLSTTVINESGFINRTGYILTNSSILGFNSPNIVIAINGTDGTVIAAPNYTVSSTGNVTNASAAQFPKVNFTYSYNYPSIAEANSINLLANTSGGIVGFFISVNPVYPILAILVIIMVLIVLVRITTSSVGANRQTQPQI